MTCTVQHCHVTSVHEAQNPLLAPNAAGGTDGLVLPGDGNSVDVGVAGTDVVGLGDDKAGAGNACIRLYRVLKVSIAASCGR
jgi:hypothetical protein